MDTKNIAREIVNKYYQECNASNPPKTYLAMEIAEISFKAGQEEESTQAYNAGLVDGRLRGIREVVEWVDKTLKPFFVAQTLREWCAKLKDWGIE